MAIIFSEEQKVFSLHTKKTTYQIKISHHGYLLHVYYGDRIEDADISEVIVGHDRGFSGNPNQAGNDRAFSLDTLPQEFTGAGLGDYRVSSIDVQNHDGSNAFDGRYESHRIYEGKYTMKGLPGLRAAEGDHAATLEITLQDEVTGLRVILCYGVFEEADVITRTVRVENGGQDQILLRKIMSVTMDYLESDFDLIHFDGRHAMEREMHRDQLAFGQLSVGSMRGASSHQHNPFVILAESGTDEDRGGCYGFSFVYSGNFVCTVEKDQVEQARLVMGIHPDRFTWPMAPGESFQAPEVIMAYSSEGLTGLSRIYHDAFRTGLCDSRFMKEKRPVLLNSWEASYFDFTHDSLVAMAKKAVALGVDLFVLDDGWFGERHDDTAALGDWNVNYEKLPYGLDGLTKEVNALGLEMGLWVEPEMISEDSRLYELHPEWCLKIPGRPVTRSRYQLVLDLSRQDVQDFIYDFLDRILNSANISYIKWDMNRSISEVFSAQAQNNEMGTILHKYMLGLYAILDKITHAHPDVLFEGCSGGGGRFDAGMLCYHPQIWCSDNTDAINRLKIQYGTSFGYPVSSMGAHVSVCPNHQTGRTVPLKTRGIVAMNGTFGYELDPNKMTDAELAECNEMTQTFKKYNDLIFNGDYYRLESPYSRKGFAAWAFVSKDKEEALVNIVLTDKEANSVQRYLRLKGIQEDAFYEVEGLGCCRSGRALMKAGIPIHTGAGEYKAMQYHLYKRSL